MTIGDLLTQRTQTGIHFNLYFISDIQYYLISYNSDVDFDSNNNKTFMSNQFFSKVDLSFYSLSFEFEYFFFLSYFIYRKTLN